jgi:hypothetical protein
VWRGGALITHQDQQWPDFQYLDSIKPRAVHSARPGWLPDTRGTPGTNGAARLVRLEAAAVELNQVEPWADGDAVRKSALPSADIRFRRGQGIFRLVTWGEVRLGSPRLYEEINADQH